MITTADGVALESRWDDATTDARLVTVLCHPHPLDGGTMLAPLMQAVAIELTSVGAHVLRFNFRGVGTSGGSWGGGTKEIEDVAAAIEAAGLAFPELPIAVAGWSFGASTSLGWLAMTASHLPWVGIAPGVRPYRGARPPDIDGLRPGPRLIVVGDRDQFATVEEIRDLADSIGAGVEVVAGSDHFFYFREATVGQLAARFLVSVVED